MSSQEDIFHELSYYTTSHPSPSFIHQHVVDAFAAQTADEDTKPIKITFALLGLYLFLEKDFTGRQVQLTHMKIAKVKDNVDWPKIIYPEDKGSITISDVLQSTPGEERDLMIKKWCLSVWEAYSDSHLQIVDFLNKYFF
jgi:hypothetical protein